MEGGVSPSRRIPPGQDRRLHGSDFNAPAPPD
jgi:hypothetical protein